MTLLSDVGVLWKAWDLVAATRLGKALTRRFAKRGYLLLLGSTGVGKSQFLISIDDAMANPIPAGARTESSVSKEKTINDKTFTVRDVPGQREHSQIRSDEIKRTVGIRRRAIYINLVCYGYHEFGASLSDVVEGGQIKESFLVENREREIVLLNEVANLLDNETLITVVTKADIWWDQKQNVIKYYTSGEYGCRIRAVFPRARHIVRGYSSINKNFYGIERSHNFDDEQRVLLRTELFRVICEAM